MKKIRLKKREERKTKWGLIIGGLFLVGTMFFSMFEIFSNRNGQVVRYKDFKFTYDEDSRLFLLKINKTEMPFSYLPDDVKDIAVPGEAISLFKSAPGAYMTFDPDDEKHLRLFDAMRFDFARYSGRNILGAITKESEKFTGAYTFPVKTCADAMPTAPVIYLDSSTNETGIIVEGSCIIFKSEELGFVKLRDRFYYALFGVME